MEAPLPTVVVYGISRYTEAIAFLRACRRAAMVPQTLLIDERRRAIAVNANDQVFLKETKSGMPIEWVRDPKLWAPRLVRDLRRRLEFARLDPTSQVVRVSLSASAAKRSPAAS